jgi:hypothetical protein
MNKHTHDIIISPFLSTHAPLICKHDPTPNPSFPIYQLIQHITKKLTIVNLSAKNWIIHQLGFIEESTTKFNKTTTSSFKAM